MRKEVVRIINEACARFSIAAPSYEENGDLAMEGSTPIVESCNRLDSAHFLRAVIFEPDNPIGERKTA